jgi:hypothetical protein
MLALAYVFFAAQPLLSDVAYFIASDQRILNGAIPYVDIIENNPPLAFWFTMPPVWFAHAIGARAGAAFIIYVLILVAGILALIWQLHGHGERGRHYRQRLILILAFVMLFCLAFGFGQREYFATLFLLPYISAVALRAKGQINMTAHLPLVGLLGGIGVCFKPYFLIIPFALEIYLFLQTQNWKSFLRQDVLVAVAVVAIYPALVWFIYPTYFNLIVPLTILTYDVYNASYAAILNSSAVMLFLIAASFTVALLVWGRIQDRGCLTWLVTAFAGLVIHFLQHMGWPYHILPALAFVTIALLLSALSFRNPIVHIVTLMAVALSSFTGLMNYRQSQLDWSTRFDQLLAGRQPRRMIVLTYDLGLVFPYLPEHDIAWVGHYQSLWPMAAVVKKTISEEKSKTVIADVAKNLTFDLIDESPDHIIVDHRPVFSDHVVGDDGPISRLSAFTDFSAAWSNYFMIKDDGRFQLWQRK